MALVLHLKRGAQVIVSGAVLENVGANSVSLAVKNEAAILRGEDILRPDAAVTPASRAYYALQCAYLFPETRAVNLDHFHALLTSYVEAAPSASAIAVAIRANVDEGNLYAALKKAQSLIQHEAKVLTNVHERLAEALQLPPSAG